MNVEKTYRFIISGGGTGGHIYPALAVANEIMYRHPNAQILFVGAKGRMEMTKVPEAGYKIIGLWISGLYRKITIENIMFPFKVLYSLIAAKQILKRFKPDAVIGFGGYASGPITLAAVGKGIPTMIQEQNSYAGITNKRLGSRVHTVCVAYEGMEKFFPAKKLRLTGNPVRKDILTANEKRAEAFKHFGLDPDRKTILIIGGSLGARTINNSVLAGLNKLELTKVQLIWQTGRFYYSQILDKTRNYDLSSIKILEFIKEMDMAYAAADIVIARAGALSISELCLVGKPVIFVPSPNVAEDHQTKNAQALVKKDAAMMVTDDDAPDVLIDEAFKLLNDEDRKATYIENIKKLGKPNATEDIVNELFELVK